MGAEENELNIVTFYGEKIERPSCREVCRFGNVMGKAKAGRR